MHNGIVNGATTLTATLRIVSATGVERTVSLDAATPIVILPGDQVFLEDVDTQSTVLGQLNNDLLITLTLPGGQVEVVTLQGFFETGDLSPTFRINDLTPVDRAFLHDRLAPAAGNQQQGDNPPPQGGARQGNGLPVDDLFENTPLYDDGNQDGEEGGNPDGDEPPPPPGRPLFRTA